MPTAAQDDLSAILRSWKQDAKARTPDGAFHYGIKIPPGATKPEVCREIFRCGPMTGGYLRRLEHQLSVSGALALLESFSRKVNPGLFQLQAASFRGHLHEPALISELPNGGFFAHLGPASLPFNNLSCSRSTSTGNAWEFRVVNVGMVAAKVHCDPGDFGFTHILLLGKRDPKIISLRSLPLFY